MFDHLVRDLQILRKADFMVARIWLDTLVRRSGLMAFAALIAVFGLGMANVAGFYGLEGSLGPVWAAAIVALVDMAIAVVIMLVARNAHPGPEIEIAFELRASALDAIRGDMRDVTGKIAQLGHNPLDIAAQTLLVPAALSILRGLRARKEHAR
jgi:hypothetical protein